MEKMKGTALLELVVYVGIATAIASSMLAMGVRSAAIKKSLGDADAVEQASRLAGEAIGVRVRGAKAVLTPLPGATSSALSIDSGIASTTPTVFSVVSGYLDIAEGSSTSAHVTPGGVTVSGLQFQNMSYAGTSGAVQAKFSAISGKTKKDFSFSSSLYAKVDTHPTSSAAAPGPVTTYTQTKSATMGSQLGDGVSGMNWYPMGSTIWSVTNSSGTQKKTGTLRYSAFNFTIPANATVVSFAFALVHTANPSAAYDDTAYVAKAGVHMGANMASGAVWTGGISKPSNYAGINSANLTPAYVNASSFALDITALLNGTNTVTAWSASSTVTYTVPAS